jgi:hypothetical protein
MLVWWLYIFGHPSNDRPMLLTFRDRQAEAHWSGLLTTTKQLPVSKCRSILNTQWQTWTCLLAVKLLPHCDLESSSLETSYCLLYSSQTLLQAHWLRKIGLRCKRIRTANVGRANDLPCRIKQDAWFMVAHPMTRLCERTIELFSVLLFGD